MRNFLLKLPEYVNKVPQIVWIILVIFLLVLVGTIDYLLGWEISFAIGFLLPITLVTWFVGRNAGIIVSVLSAAIRLTVVFWENPPYSNMLIPCYNIAIRLFFFLLITYLLSAIKNLLEREKKFARIDPLTGLANRRLFFEMAEHEIQMALRFKRPFSLAYMDIDLFKTINDRLGHKKGDELLFVVAKNMREYVRIIDTVARIGGDEFVILMPETDHKGAQQVVSRINKKILDVIHKEDWFVTFSFGVATFLRSPASVTEMLDMVDKLMYISKSEGNNKITHKTFGT